jgi:hypothetical protein
MAGQARAAISIDSERVPEDLRDLIPFVERWGVGDDVSVFARSHRRDGALRAEYKLRNQRPKDLSLDTRHSTLET